MFGRQHTSVVKVKSHSKICDLATLEDKWACVGNDAADIAANRARNSLNQDIVGKTNVLHFANLRAEKAIKEAHTLLGKISRLQVSELTQKEDLVQSDPVVKLCGSVHSTWPTRTLPEFDERCRDEAFWGITYMLRLYHWVSTLRWAPHVQEDEWGVSWIELFLSFQMSTESDIPVNLGTDDRPLFALPEHNEAVKLIKPTAHKRMISFEKSLRALGKILGVELFPCNTCSRPQSLRALGFFQARPGLQKRPWFPFHENITQALRNKAGCPVIIGDLPTLVETFA